MIIGDPETVCSDHNAGMNQNTLTNLHTIAYRNASHQFRVSSNFDVLADNTARAYVHTITNFSAIGNDRVRSDVSRR